ncbi:autotransporter assembly complex protein TamA [Neorhizobium sp. NPDC001467]|uniref:autotransporter assembly complex protein TamA n=1 Tax=Neorhizobium sp. NPDC001467 TaxID=3390595 RepID=UPI003CFD6F0F
MASRGATIVALAVAAAGSPVLIDRAHALKIFGLTLFESDDDKIEVIDPVRYDVAFDAGNADSDLEERLENAASLVADKENPVSGDLGIVIKAREDRDRLVAVLFEEARYGGIVTITIAGQDLDRLPPNPTFDRSNPVPVTVSVEPGPVFTLGRITMLGDAAGRDPKEYDLVPDGKAGSRLIIKAGETIVHDLKNEGRPLAALTRREVVADHATNKVDVTLEARGGPVAPFGNVAVKGARAVDPDFIRRYSRLDQGQQYSPDQMKKAADRLRELSVFSSLTIQEDKMLAPDGSIPLSIEVSEGKFRYFGFGAEYSSLDGGGLSGYWGHRNLFGQAESLRFEGEVSGLGSTAGTDVTDLNYRAGVYFRKPGMFLPRITFDASLEAKTENYDSYDAESVTALGQFTYELTDQDTFTGGGEIAYTQTRDVYGNNDYLTFSLPIGYERDTRDNKLDPTEGHFGTLLAKPSYEALNGSVFSSFEGSISGYLGLAQEDRVVLAGKLAAGTLIGADGLASIPATRRFYAGGGGSVRGYSYREISPYNDNGDALGGRSYLLTSLEARIKITDTIGIVPFLDVGTVATEIVPDFSDIRMGAGIGLRYGTPFGPLRIDFALPLDRYEGGSSYGIYAGIGQSF